MAAIHAAPIVVRPGLSKDATVYRAPARGRPRCHDADAWASGAYLTPVAAGTTPLSFVRMGTCLRGEGTPATGAGRPGSPHASEGKQKGRTTWVRPFFEVGCSSALAAAPEAGVQRVAEGVAEQVEGEHQQTDCQSGVDCQAGLGAHVLATLQAEHLAPAWEWRR